MKPGILVVDDEPLIRWALREFLEGAGFSVTLSASGEEALSHREEPFEAYVLDYRLPDMTGLDLYEALTAGLKGTTPAVLFSAHMGSDVTDRARRAGVRACLNKPADLDRLTGIVADLVRNRGV